MKTSGLPQPECVTVTSTQIPWSRNGQELYYNGANGDLVSGSSKLYRKTGEYVGRYDDLAWHSGIIRKY